MDSDQLVYDLLSVLGRKHQFSVWAAKYFAQEHSYWQSYRDRSFLIFICPAYTMIKLRYSAWMFI